MNEYILSKNFNATRAQVLNGRGVVVAEGSGPAMLAAERLLSGKCEREQHMGIHWPGCSSPRRECDCTDGREAP